MAGSFKPGGYGVHPATGGRGMGMLTDVSLFRYRPHCEWWQVGHVYLVVLELPKVGNVAVCCFVVFQTKGVSCQKR